MLKRVSNTLVDDLAVTRDAGAFHNLIIQVLVRRAFGKKMLQQIEDVLRIHLTRVHGNCCRQIDSADDLDTIAQNCYSRLRQLAVAALLGCQIDNDRT